MFTSSIGTGSSPFSGINAPAPSGTFDFDGNRHSFGRDIRGLVSAIQSGNTSGAQQFLSQIQQIYPPGANSNSPVSQFLTGVAGAFANNDIAGAQAALATFQNQRSHGPAGGTGANETGGTPGAAGGGATDAAATFGQDVLALFTAIGSGNLQNAQSAYDTVTVLLLGGAAGSTPTTAATAAASGSGSGATASSATTVESPANAPFTSLLAQIGSALSTGDIDSAQTAVDSFLQSLSAGSVVGAAA
jgi:hypothetical protein